MNNYNMGALHHFIPTLLVHPGLLSERAMVVMNHARCRVGSVKRQGLRVLSFLIALVCSFSSFELKAQCTNPVTGTTLVSVGQWSAPTVPPNTSVVLAVTTTIGSPVATVGACNAVLVTNLAPITGTSFPGGTNVTNATACNNLTMSQNATVTATGVPHTFFLPAYALAYPPTNQGVPAGLNCSVCPSTFTASVCASEYFNVYMCQGNVYTVSMCGSASNADFSLSLTTTANAAIAPGYYGQVFDNDGCGPVGGPSTLTFSPQVSGTYRVRVFRNPCVIDAALCGTLTVSCSLPSPPPNDEPCTALALPVPTACSYQATTNLWATSTTGVPTPSCGAYFGRDVWYSAVVPASGNLQVQATLISASSLGVAVYTAPSCGASLASWTEILCSNSMSPLLPLSGLVAPGTTVYIRAWPQGSIANMGTFNICAFEPTPPSNDLPCGSFIQSTPAICTPNTYTTQFASNTVPPGLTVGAPSCGAPVQNDVWFSVVVPASGAFTANTFAGTLNNMAMAWYRLSAGGSTCMPFSGTMTQIACNDNQLAPTNNMPRINSQTAVPAIAPALVPGETIYLRIWAQGATVNGTFDLCVTENFPPPNDDPCGAIALTTSLSCNLVPTTNEGAGLTVGPPLPGCGLPVQNDVWYTVTVPPNGQLEINSQGVVMTDAALALYQVTGGSCATSNLTLALVPPVNCQVGGSSFGAAMPQQLFAGLTPGATVYVRVWRQTGTVGAFNICARQTAAAPVNGCDINNYDSGGPTGNYGNNEVYEQTFCAINPGDVVSLAFLSFSTQANNDFMTIYNGPSIASPILGTYSGGSLPPGFTSTHASGCLTIRFTSNGSVVSNGWNLSVSCGPPLPPPPPVVGICGTVTYDSGGANGNYANNEFVTQTFCPSVAGQVVTMTFTQFSLEQNFDFLTVFNGPTVASPSLGTFTGNNLPGTFTSTDPGGCLTIRFTSDFSIVALGWAATLRCGVPQPPPPPPPPPTGLCGTLVYDPGGPNGNYFNGINQNPANQGGNGCWPLPCGTLWSQTYCPDIAGDAVTLSFQTFNIENGWDNVYVYNGPVASPYNANGTQFMSPNGLPTCGGPAGWCNQTLGPGGWSGNAIPGPFTSTHPSGCITISMTSDDIVNFAGWTALVGCQSAFNPNANCIYALRMYDSFGDGWAGSRITVVVNGGSPSYYTVQSGNYNQILLGLNNGDNVSITYNGAGYFPGDNSWTLDLLGSPYSQFHSAIPAVGGTYNFTVNCAPPLAPQQDCIGAQILCNNNPVTVNATNVGSVGDLTTTTGGCLGNIERQGSWYTFTAGTALPIGFTMTPTGATDINYAVWGPYPNASAIASMCTPAGAPIRCSFATAANTNSATGSYNTGIGSPTYSAPQYANPTPASSQTTAGNGWLPGIIPTAGDVYLLYISNATGNSTSSTLSWTGTGVVECIILPIELLHFDARANNSDVDITWRTASEINSAWFNVQRSSDASSFHTIGRSAAAGISTFLLSYLHVDKDPLPGLSYYRLEQVDNDGSVSYSHVVPVHFAGREPLFSLHPNPAHDQIVISMELPTDGDYDWVVQDPSGRLALSGIGNGGPGTTSKVIPIGRLETGSYLLQVRQNGMPVGRARFMKQ